MTYIVSGMGNKKMYIRPDVLGDHRSVDISLTGDFAHDVIQFSYDDMFGLLDSIEWAVDEAQNLDEDTCRYLHWTNMEND